MARRKGQIVPRIVFATSVTGSALPALATHACSRYEELGVAAIAYCTERTGGRFEAPFNGCPCGTRDERGVEVRCEAEAGPFPSVGDGGGSDVTDVPDAIADGAVDGAAAGDAAAGDAAGGDAAGD